MYRTAGPYSLEQIVKADVTSIIIRNFVISFARLHKNIKNLVWQSPNFLLPYIIVKEYFISITFIFNPYFLCFVVDELPAFLIIVHNF